MKFVHIIYLVILSLIPEMVYAQKLEAKYKHSKYEYQENNIWKVTSDVRDKEENYFSVKGILNEKRYYRSDSTHIPLKLRTYETIAYDKYQRVVERIINQNNGQLSKTINRLSYTPTGKIRRTEEQVFTGNAPAIQTDHLIKNYTYFSNDSLKSAFDSTKRFSNMEKNIFEWDYWGYFYKYNSTGRLIQKYFDFDPNYQGEPRYSKYIYDKDGLNERTIFIYNGLNGSNPADTTFIKKDESGNIVEIRNSYSLTKKTYDANKNLISEIGKSSYSSSYRNNKYNTDGLLVEEEYFYSDKASGLAHKTEIHQTTLFDYDEKKRIKSSFSSGRIFTNYSYPWGERPFRYKEEFTYSEENIGETSSNDFLVYPNPATDWLSVENTLGVDCIKSIQITDIFAKEIVYQSYKPTNYLLNGNGKCSANFDIHTLPNGMYLIVIDAGNDKKIAKRFMVNR